MIFVINYFYEANFHQLRNTVNSLFFVPKNAATPPPLGILLFGNRMVNASPGLHVTITILLGGLGCIIFTLERIRHYISLQHPRAAHALRSDQ